MTTTTKLQDYLGRWLSNATPGTTNATDFLGRNVLAGDHDFLGVGLTFSQPPLWVASTAYTVGQYVRGTGGQIAVCTVAGTSGATEPVWPAVGGTVISAPPLTWARVH